MAQESSQGKNVSVEYAYGLHLLSLQGPKALELLDRHTPIDLPPMNYFHHQETEVFGCPCTLSRTGFSGERGYEMFVSPEFACDIWDNILTSGKDMGIMPCSLSSIFSLRMEAGLLWRRFDLMENTPWEVRMGWVVHRNKGDFRGKEAVLAAEGKERFLVSGIVADIPHPLNGGEKLMLNGKEVGVVHEKPSYSHRLNKSLALVRLQPEYATAGTKLEVAGENMSCMATVEKFPLYDPEKKRTHEVN
jgi:aminomethyltransferase